MKRNLTIGLVAIATVIVVVAAGAIVLRGQNDNSYSPKVGDFLKYSTSFHSNSRNNTDTTNETLEILGINATSIYYRLTMEGGIPGFYNATKNQTLFDWDPSSYQSLNFTFLGKEKINTTWGQVNTDHYNITIAEGDWGDWWTCNNVVVKFVEVSSGGDVTNTFVLIDTNISQLKS